MRKRVLSLLVSLFFVVVTAYSAAAQDGLLNGLVLDVADLLDVEEEQELAWWASELTQEYECAVYLITVDSLRDMSPEEFTQALHRQNDLGWGEERSCIILMLSMEERDYDIMAHGYGNTVFTDYGKDQMAERFLEYFLKDDYYGGFCSYLESCQEYFEQARMGVPYDVEDEIEFYSLTALLFCVPIPLVVAAIVCTVFKSQMKTVRPQYTAGSYIPQDGFRLTQREDLYLHTTRSRRRIQSSSTGSGRSGGTTVGRSGSSHKSGKF